jgi:hypothetical protein
MKYSRNKKAVGCDMMNLELTKYALIALLHILGTAKYMLEK